MAMANTGHTIRCPQCGSLIPDGHAPMTLTDALTVAAEAAEAGWIVWEVALMGEHLKIAKGELPAHYLVALGSRNPDAKWGDRVTISRREQWQGQKPPQLQANVQAVKARARG